MSTLVISITNEGYETQVESGMHTVITDEPVALGGKDEGPSPYELLLSALASCTGITLRMYADRKKWPLKKVVVEVTHEKKYGDDCEHTEDEKARLDHFTRKIRVHGDLTQEQVDKLLEIAEKCPVHKTLCSDSKIETSIQH